MNNAHDIQTTPTADDVTMTVRDALAAAGISYVGWSEIGVADDHGKQVFAVDAGDEVLHITIARA